MKITIILNILLYQSTLWYMGMCHQQAHIRERSRKKRKKLIQDRCLNKDCTKLETDIKIKTKMKGQSSI